MNADASVMRAAGVEMHAATLDTTPAVAFMRTATVEMTPATLEMNAMGLRVRPLRAARRDEPAFNPRTDANCGN
jgi:hypothetical protein